MKFPLKDKHGKSYTWGQAFTLKFIPRLESYGLDLSLMFLHLTTLIPSHAIRNFIWRSFGLNLGNVLEINTPSGTNDKSFSLNSSIDLGANYKKTGKRIVGEYNWD